MNQENKVVKVSDVVQNQIPEFILTENPNFVEFLKQYYISQEFQGSTIDIAENLISYKNLDSFDSKNLIAETTLSSDVEFFDDVINVESTHGWPQEYGLLKVDNEIITYTGITSTSFTGCIRGFSGISSLTQENNPEFLVFSQSEASEHTEDSTVHNLSNLFLKEFFEKIKYQFTPGFENRDFAPQINPQNFISKAKTFYQSKGTDEAFKILFKVLYAENVKIIKPDDYCFTPSDGKWRIVETFVCELVDGDPFKINGQTLYQDKFSQYNIETANGSIYNVESFKSRGETFYKLQIFSGYSNNLNPRGSIEGTFVTTPKTFVVEDTAVDSTILTVDSTIGFSNSGILEINGQIVTYTDKTNNQFLNCSGINTSISKKTKVFSDHFIYAIEENSSAVVKFKLCNVLSKLDLSNTDVVLAYDEDPIEITQVGSSESSIFLNSLVYNHAISVSPGNVVNELTTQIRNNQKEGFSISGGVALCKFPHYLKAGDVVDLYFENTNATIATNLAVNFINSKEFSVSTTVISQQYGNLNSLLGKRILFRRRIEKSPNLNLTANIQDSFVDNDSYYLTTNGLPEYQVSPLTLDKSFSVVNIDTLSDDTNHYFNTGDEVTVVSFTASQGFKNEIGISTGISYYVTKVNDAQIRLSQSRENIEILSHVLFFEYNQFNIESGRVNNITLVPTAQYGNSFTSTKLFKKIPKTPQLSLTKENTSPGNLGVFVNGVELRNYKSFNKIYYGPVESVSVLNSGSNYNLSNPPRFEVFFNNAKYPNSKIIPQLKGKLAKLSVTDPGFDYVEVPTVEILGGNNPTIVTEVKIKNTNNEIEFNSTSKDNVVDTVNNIFVFSDKHRFITGEPILYKTFNTTSIGIGTQVSDGFLTNNSIYYVVNVGAGTSMALAFNQKDAYEGTNLINLRTFGGGLQSFISTLPKKIIDEVNIIQNESEFEYKKVSFIAEDINLQDDIITVENHGFSTGEEVVYSWEPAPGFNGNTIGGLDTNLYYYIVKIDDNRFKLTYTKNGTDYVDLLSKENFSTYFIEYSPIRVSILGAVSTTGVSTFIGYDATIVPIVEGSVVGASLQRNPQLIVDTFGRTDIIDYEKSPEIRIVEGSGASLQPIIVDGKIKEVVVKTSGSGYFNSFDLVVNGNGFGAKLVPTIIQGTIIDVKVVNGGVGYASTNTTINIIPLGSDVKLKANIKSWNIDDISRYGINNIQDGLLFGKNYSLIGNTYGTFFLNQNLRQFFNIPSSPSTHSPIIGWAYDGCPIYGPYAYTNIDGSGGIIRMRSGYSYSNPIGSFCRLVEEYVFTNSGTLDEYNGRFCVTPEYPNGVYAYFCTLDENNTPEFPYVVGPKYNYSPIEENFDLNKNQTLNFNNLNIIKWTSPYRISDQDYKYEYFELFKNSNGKDVIIEKSSVGVIDSINVIDSGIDYQVGDSVIFDNSNASGFGAIAKVSEVSGVSVTSISSETKSFSNVTFISDGTSVTGIASTYHSLKTNSFINISGISTSSYESLEGFEKIIVPSIVTTLASNLGPSSITGIVTSIQVNESIRTFDVDSYLTISNEIVKVVGADYQNNLLNILRPPSAPAHAALETITLLQNKFQYVSSEFTPVISEVDQNYYFDSSNAVSTGTNTSPGIGNTLTIYPLGVGIPYVKYVQTGGIYLPNNKFSTGDKLNYTEDTATIVTNYGDLNAFSELYVLKLENDVVGLVTSKTDISNPSRILTYTSVGSGNLHKFKTEKNIVTGTITQNDCVVSTASTHGLSVGSLIKFNVKSGITTTFDVTYSNNRVLIDSDTNPKIDVYTNDTVVFDLSDVSLSGKTFNLYTDEDFLNLYVGNIDNGIEVERTTTQLTLNVSDYTPKTLFYNLSDSITDITVENFNQLSINASEYNIESIITESTSNQFKFNLSSTPERSSYTNPSTLSYSVLSEGILGPISNIEIISKGSQYKKLPIISSVDSEFGSGCNLFAKSNSIGKIERSRVNNSQLICPFDKTLTPQSNIFSILKLTDNYTVDSLIVNSTGQNYLFSPKIKLYSESDNSIISQFSASATLKNNSIDDIKILNPGFGLKSNDNKIIVIDNSNGFNIINASVTGSGPYTITLTLKTPTSGFTTSNPLPISIGDEIFVEKIVSTGGDGFNSSDYNYNPFTVTFVDPAFGSQDAAIVRYQTTQNPGSYSSTLTYDANVIPYSYLPQIEPVLKQNVFYNEEFVNDLRIIKNQKNNPITNLLKVKQSENIQINDIVTGKSSNSKGKVVEINNFKSSFISDYSVSEILGGQENRGYLSSNIQKLSDNDYYQKFSYSLKSNKSFSDWESPVSDITHTSGYKKFSDLSVESVGIGTTQSIKTDSTSTLNVILDSYVDVNSISDYDLVNEIDIEDTDYEYSQYLKFSRLKLGQSLKSVDNRVLSIDDISNLFNVEPTVPEVAIDSTFSTDSIALKYTFYLTASEGFLGDFVYPEVFELLVVRNANDVDLTSYASYFDAENLGANAVLGRFTAEINPSNDNELVLSFRPTNPFISIDIKSIKETTPSTVGVATTAFGYVKNVELTQQYNTSGVSTFYSIPLSDCKSGTLIVGISSTKNSINKSLELSFTNTSNDLFISKYAENDLVNYGNINIIANGSNLEFNFDNTTGIGVTLYANLKLLTNTYAGYDSINKTFSKISSSEITTNSLSTGISTVSGIYGFTKYIMEISQDTGITTYRSIVQLNSVHSGDYLNNIVYDINGDIELTDIVFETNYSLAQNEYTLSFNPVTSANYTIKIYEANILSPNQ
jgi:hypothetical protein